MRKAAAAIVDQPSDANCGRSSERRRVSQREMHVLPSDGSWHHKLLKKRAAIDDTADKQSGRTRRRPKAAVRVASRGLSKASQTRADAGIAIRLCLMKPARDHQEDRRFCRPPLVRRGDEPGKSGAHHSQAQKVRIVHADIAGVCSRECGQKPDCSDTSRQSARLPR